MLDVEWLDVLLLLYIKSEIEANKLYFKFSNTFCVKTILIRERRDKKYVWVYAKKDTNIMNFMFC